MTVSLANYWVQKGWDVHVVTLARRDEDAYQLNARVQRTELNLAQASQTLLEAVPANLQRIRALRSVLLRIRPNVVVSMMAPCNVILAWASLGIRDMSIIGSERVHPPEVPLGRVWEYLRFISYGLLDAVVAQTGETKSWIISNTLARRTVVIPNPALPKESVTPSTAGITEYIARKKLLAVGRLEYQKGFDVLIEVFARIASRFGDWDLVIVGDGSLESELRERIGVLQLTHRVTLAGYTAHITDWYRSAELFVCSSRFEGFPNALVEAMAHGLPVVSFDCKTGPREIIRHGVDGILVPAGDEDALLSALVQAMSDTELRKRLASHAPEVQLKYALATVSGLWEKLFDTLQ